MAPPTTPAAMPQPYLPACAALVGTVRLAASVTTARPVAIFDLRFMTCSLWDFWGTGMVLMAIGRTGAGKVQPGGGRVRGLCEKSQKCLRLTPSKQEGPVARPFATKSATMIYCAVTLGCGAPCPAAEAALGCTARIA